MLPIRDCVHQTPAYIPGEQPQTDDYIKLNTNENPYPPPSEIFEALPSELAKVRLYPDPVSTQLRKAAANVFGVQSENILAGNGSDDILNIALRTFVNPGERVTCLDLTYSLYETLTRVHGAEIHRVATDEQFDLAEPIVDPAAKLIFLASPNPPVGRHLDRRILEETCARNQAVVLIDEAYGDFSDESYLDFVDRFENVIVSRTMSKSYSLAGMRIGFGIASTSLIQQMDKVRDSYNMDRIAQALGTAALERHAYFQSIWQRVRRTRDRLRDALQSLAFEVLESEANFVLAAPNWIAASELYAQLKERKVLVRYFSHPRIQNFVRISIGTDEEIDRLLAAIADIQQSRQPSQP